MSVTAEKLKAHLQDAIDPKVFNQLSKESFEELENMAKTLNQPQQVERAPARGR